MNDIDPSFPVVVVKFHRGTVGIVRSLGRLGVPVYGIHSDRSAAGIASSYLREVFEHDVEQAPAEQSLALLDRIGQRIGREAILIPTSDRTARFVAEHAGRLRSRFRFAAQTTAELGCLTNRRALFALAARLGVATPESAFPANADEAARAAEELGFPLLLKSVADDLPSGERLELISDAVKLAARVRLAGTPGSWMLQEFLAPGRSALWIFNGYFDRQSSPLAAVSARKLRQYPVNGGPASLGVCEPNPELERRSVDLMRAISYRGPVDMDWIHDRRDGSYRLLDVNPRIGASFRLFAPDDGADIARVLYRDLSGQPPAAMASSPRPGRRWLAEDSDVRAFAGYYREASLGIGAWLRSLRGLDETVWFAGDDLGPFVLMCGDLLREQVSAVRRRWTGQQEQLPARRQAAGELGIDVAKE